MLNSKIIKLTALFAVLCFSLTLLPGYPADRVQAANLDTKDRYSGRGAGYASVLYDRSNGLPTSEANAIATTSDGFIWIGSYSGLIRYDGNEFERMDASTGITSVVSLFVDSKDRLWVGTNDSGVVVIEDGEYTIFDREDGLESSSIRSVVEDKEGMIYIATTHGMVTVDQSMKMETFDEPQLNDEYICELQVDSAGTVYGETIGGAVFTIENRKLTGFYNGSDVGMSEINCITPDPASPGCVYLGTERSDIYYADFNQGLKGFETISVEPATTINAVYVMDGQVWICADNGIGYLDDKKKFVQLENIPMNNSVDEMMVDYEDNLWFASSRQGVMKIVPNIFIDISQQAQFDSMVVNSTCKYQGNLYVGTDTGLFILDSDYQKMETECSVFLEGVRIRSIKKDSRNNLWFATFSDKGLVCLHEDGSFDSYTDKDGLPSTRVRTVMEMSDGTIAASASGGVVLLKDGKITKTYDSASGITNPEILSLCEGDDGKLYMGSDGNGIFVADSNKVSRLGLDDGLESEVILRIKKDEAHGVYWLITSNSIAYMKDDKITTITNFPYSNNFDLFVDESDHLWILSSNGIYVVDAQNMMANKEIEYVFYDSKCGLPCVATANSRSCIDSDGTLYISGTTGVSSVNINTSGDDMQNMILTVPFVKADDETIYVDEDGTVTIPASCKRLVIYDYALTYSLRNPRIAYKLDGFDDIATTLTKQEMKPISYTNLDGGSYTFHLELVSADTGAVDKELKIRIIKKKAIYEQVWFWIVAALLGALLIAMIATLYIRKKTAALLKKQEENRIFINQMIQAFAKCIDMKDNYTRGHSFRVAKYTTLLAQKMGYSKEEVEEYHNIALLHDIGKISIPDSILNKPEGLSDEEYQVMRSHAANGYEILKDIKILPNLAIGAGYHHERLDGKGYPRGVTAEEIPMVAQIIAVADTFDAMYSTRPYRKKMELSVVAAEIEKGAGTQLNADVVKVFMELVREGAFDDDDTE